MFWCFCTIIAPRLCPDNVGFMESACNHPQVVLYERNAADELEIRTDAGQFLKAPGTSQRFQFSTWEPDPVQVRHCLEGCWSAVPNAQQFHSLGLQRCPNTKWVHLDKFIPKHWDWWPQQCDQDDLEAALYQWFAYKVTDVAELVWICEGWRQDHDFSTF